MYYQIAIIFHILFGLSVIGLVLMQQGKGADAGAAFGSGSSGSVFGAQGAATFLSKSTAVFASLFFVTSLSLAWLSGQQNKEVDIMDLPETELFKPDVPVIEDSVSGVVEESIPTIDSPDGEMSSQIVEEIQQQIDKVVEQKEAVSQELLETEFTEDSVISVPSE